MNRKIKEIKEEKIKVSQLYQITSSLKSVAVTKRFQITRQLKNLSRIINAINQIKHRFFNTEFRSTKQMHIIMSCDQKFCKNFISLTNKHIAEYPFPSDAQIILFGTKSGLVLPDGPNIIKCRLMQGSGDAKNIAFRIADMGYPRTFVHAYCDEEKRMRAFDLMSISKPGGIEPEENKDFWRMYFAIQVYKHALENALKENADRATAMSEASDNAEKRTEALDREYHNKRKLDVTNEVLSWSNDSDI